jgi:PAS domain S-box-containing protein
MFNHLKIGTKILLIITLVSILAISISGYIGYDTAKQSLTEESFNKLTAVRELKANQIEAYFQQISDQVLTFSEDRMIVKAMMAFKTGFQNLETELDITDMSDIDLKLQAYYQNEYLTRLLPNLDEDKVQVSVSDYWPTDDNHRILQSLYISSNPQPTGSKQLLDFAEDISHYSKAHKIYHPVIRNYLEKFGYYDIFLVDNNGHIVYTVFKEVDYGTSLLTGPYKNTHFAAAFKAAQASADKNFVKLVDFEPYHPSYNNQASFIASPIFDGEEKIGVLIFQMPEDKINNIMTNNLQWSKVGLGMSGETYLVGDDYTLRNQSRFLIEDRDNYFKMLAQIGVSEKLRTKMHNLNMSIGLQKVKTLGTEAALRGETGTQIFSDYRGVPVLSSYKPLNIKDVHWVIISEIDKAEAFFYVYSLRNQILLSLLGLVVMVLVVSLVFAKTLTRPLNALTAKAIELSKGNLNVQIEADTYGQDEIGDLARSCHIMQQSLNQLVEELKIHQDNLEIKVIERTKELKTASQRIKSIVANASDAIITIDAEKNIVLFNPASENIFGYPVDEVLGESINILLPHAARKNHDEEINKFQNQSSASNKLMGKRREVYGQRKDGTLFSAEASISKMLLENKIFFTAFLRDISERKQMEQQLHEAFQTIKAQKERMENELKIGHEIQMSMVPLIFPPFPNHQEFDVYAILKPAREVGGDFYDFFFIDEDHFCLCIGDVSGKGVPSALFMAVTKTLIKSRASNDLSSASILTHVNDELSRENESCMFVTVFLAISNIKSGEMVYTNAGHNPPYIKRKDGTIERLDQRHGPIIGAVEGIAFKESKTVLAKLDVLLTYTDGVTEAMDSEKHLFSEDRLAKNLEVNSYSSVKDMVNSIASSIEEFEGGTEQTDDITVLAIQYRGEAENTRRYNLKITVSNRLPEIVRANKEFNEFAQQYDLPKTLSRKVNLVLDELLNNIISYAYQDDKEHDIEIRVILLDKYLTIVIVDDGIPFNPFSNENLPTVDLPLEERQIGGLGIHLVHKVMDQVYYQRRINQNEVKLVKKIKD